MEKFNPNKDFTLDDVRAYKAKLDEAKAVDVSAKIAAYVDELDKLFVESVNKQDAVVLFCPEARIKIELKYYDTLKKIYEERGFYVTQNKVETGRHYENMGDFYDTEFIDYDYYIHISLPSGWEYKNNK